MPATCIPKLHGRPPTVRSIRALILRLAQEDRSSAVLKWLVSGVGRSRFWVLVLVACGVPEEGATFYVGLRIGDADLGLAAKADRPGAGRTAVRPGRSRRSSQVTVSATSTVPKAGGDAAVSPSSPWTVTRPTPVDALRRDAERSAAHEPAVPPRPKSRRTYDPFVMVSRHTHDEEGVPELFHPRFGADGRLLLTSYDGEAYGPVPVRMAAWRREEFDVGEGRVSSATEWRQHRLSLQVTDARLVLARR